MDGCLGLDTPRHEDWHLGLPLLPGQNVIPGNPFASLQNKPYIECRVGAGGGMELWFHGSTPPLMTLLLSLSSLSQGRRLNDIRLLQCHLRNNQHDTSALHMLGHPLALLPTGGDVSHPLPLEGLLALMGWSSGCIYEEIGWLLPQCTIDICPQHNGWLIISFVLLHDTRHFCNTAQWWWCDTAGQWWHDGAGWWWWWHDAARHFLTLNGNDVHHNALRRRS